MAERLPPRLPSVTSVATTTATTIIHVKVEWIEQSEPGVYINLVALRDGTRDLKRVRFSVGMSKPVVELSLED
ncbi:E3 ubiquitin protein ligase HERC2-like protein, partial [Tanacetum coccineum]